MCCFDERLPANLPSPFGRGAGVRAVASYQKSLTLTLSQRARGRRGHNRRGQALVEFAVVSLVVYMLLAAILTFGQILYSAQGLQQAVDVAARELSRTPLPADIKFQDDNNPASDVVHDSTVQSKIFDERYLVLAIIPGCNPMTFKGGLHLGDLPLVNQQLVPLMIFESGFAELNDQGQIIHGIPSLVRE